MALEKRFLVRLQTFAKHCNDVREQSDDVIASAVAKGKAHALASKRDKRHLPPLPTKTDGK